MSLKETYIRAGETMKHCFPRLYLHSLLHMLIRIPFWACLFMLFANLTLKKREDLTRVCLFSAALLVYLLGMMPARFRYGKSVCKLVNGKDPGSGSCFGSGLLRAVCGLPALPFVCGGVILWWGKNVSRINDFNRRVASLGELLTGSGADLQSRFTAGALIFGLIWLAAGILAFVCWNLSWGAELRPKGEKRFYRRMTSIQRKAAFVNAGIAAVSVLPAAVAICVYVLGAVGSAESTMTRIMTLIGLLGTLPPVWMIAVAAADLLLLYLPLHLYRKIVCCLLVTEEHGRGAVD